MQPTLPAALEAELDAIRRQPGESIGFGEKAYVPYEPNTGTGLMTSDDPGVTTRLLAEARASGDRVYRLAVLHVLGRRADPATDAALIATLDDPELRATAAYLLGRPGFKGYPARSRDDAAVATALRAHVRDDSTFEDPFYGETFRTQDFAIAAYVRVTGPEKFRIVDTNADMIGYRLPRFSGPLRADLLDQIDAIR